MPTRIDHVIIAAPDLDQLEAVFARLGFHVAGGGAHPHLGTGNRIVVLGEGYIELLGVADASRISETLRRRLAMGGGWIGYALQSGDIAAEAEAMRARGIDARGPTPGRLVSPDGRQRSWRVVAIGSDDLWAAAFPLPFLIQHDSAGEQHQRELVGAGGIAPHVNGATRLLGVTLRASDPTALRARYERADGLRALNETEDYTLGDSGEWISIRAHSPAISASNGTGAVSETMSVTVGIANATSLADVERRARASGMDASRTGDTLTVTLPFDNAPLAFHALSDR